MADLFDQGGEEPACRRDGVACEGQCRRCPQLRAGGSEVHADEFMRRWAAAGLEITHRTSAAVGQPATARRNGYAVVRRGSRYSVFPRAIAADSRAASCGRVERCGTGSRRGKLSARFPRGKPRASRQENHNV